ncbi:MAG: hypothetical protein ACXW2L_09985 [Burkholderiales bacterium]
MTVARPNKTAGRVVLGPRLLGRDYVRIVARADGSGHIERYDRQSGSWRDASEQCTFSEVWSAPAASHATDLALL